MCLMVALCVRKPSVTLWLLLALHWPHTLASLQWAFGLCFNFVVCYCVRLSHSSFCSIAE